MYTGSRPLALALSTTSSPALCLSGPSHFSAPPHTALPTAYLSHPTLVHSFAPTTTSLPPALGPPCSLTSDSSGTHLAYPPLSPTVQRADPCSPQDPQPEEVSREHHLSVRLCPLCPTQPWRRFRAQQEAFQPWGHWLPAAWKGNLGRHLWSLAPCPPGLSEGPVFSQGR